MTRSDLSTTPSTVFLPRKTCWVVGVDLGQSSDPTAVAVLEHVTGVMDEGSDRDRHCGLTEHLQTPAERVDVRHLERLPLGLSYPIVVQHVRDMLARPPLCGNENQAPAELVIDETGVGRAVGDIFLDAGLKPKRVSITAGNEATCAGRDRWHVAKTILISTVDAMLHTGTLRFAAALSEATAMKDELLDFRRKLSDAGRATYAARTGAHDDLVLAVAIACWWISRPPPPQPWFGTYGTVVSE
jgi:hypothetical protein